VIVSSTALRPDATSLESGTERFSRAESVGEGTSTRRPRAGRLRTVAALRRQRGFLGDIRYVATAAFGVRRTRRELAVLEATQVTRQAERDRYLVTLGRTAVITDGFDHAALAPVREQLVTVEEERAQHAGAVVAAEQEQQRVTRDREERAKQYTADLAAVDAELAELTRRGEPLAKEQASVTRRAADLRDALRRLDEKIADVNSQLVSPKPSKKDPAEIQAELATLKADRESVKRDEPALAAELDGLSPRLAAIDAKKTESTKRRVELVKAEEDDKRRAEELLVAIGAKRKVMDRASNDAETLRDKIMYELAEHLYVDRPEELAAQLSPIDAIDVELGSAERRIMELREILSSVDKWKFVRGVLYLAGMLAAIGAIVWFALWVFV
jgi:predicted house-cleaning noncanonical NTP pyrophosphatase (MazG superfamily)